MGHTEKVLAEPSEMPVEMLTPEEVAGCMDSATDALGTDDAEAMADSDLCEDSPDEAEEMTGVESQEDSAVAAGETANGEPWEDGAADAEEMADGESWEDSSADPEGMADGEPSEDSSADREDAERAAEGAKRSRLKGWKLSELAKRADPVWILENTIPAGLTVVYGLPKAGKSFWCIEVAACFAAGKPFHGVTLGKSGRVLYVAAEGGGKAIYNRIMAVARRRGIAEVELETNLEIVEHGMDLNNPKSVDEFLKENPGQWDLVIIDTLARCMSGDENLTLDMNMAVAECDRIRRRTRGDLVLVHHQGWTKARPRGASALFGALDALIRIYRNSDRYTVVEVEALREGAVHDNNGVLYRHVDGVLEPITPKPKGVDKLRERERKMFEVLDALYGAANSAVPIKQWRATVESVNPAILDGKSKKARDQQWRRAFANLTEVESIKVQGSDVIPWRPSDDFGEEEVEDE
jgi:hypothetical protein